MLSQHDDEGPNNYAEEDHSGTLHSVYERLRDMSPELSMTQMTQTTNNAALQSIRKHLLEEDGLATVSDTKAGDQSSAFHPAQRTPSSGALSQPPVARWNFAKRRMLTSKPPPRKHAADAWKTPMAAQKSEPQKTAELARIQRQLRNEIGADQVHDSPTNDSHPLQSSSLLDGLMLLDAGSTFPQSSVAVDPSRIERAALRDAGLCGVIAEDLEYFPNLWYLDVSGNRFRDIQPFDGLTSLRELHVVCNGIQTLHTLRDRPGVQATSSANSTLSATDLSSSLRKQSSVKSTGSLPLFASLEVLNLAYNRISPPELIHLSPLPMLQRLDLSGNALSWLPADLSFLSGVTHFALERNGFTDAYAKDESGEPSSSVFHSLSTMPSLEEVNLAHNRITKLPVLNVEDGMGVCFPLLRCLGLADNCVEVGENIIDALLVLTATLKTVVLAGNLIERNATELESVFASLMDNYNVEIVVSATVSGFYYLPNEDAASTSSPNLSSSVSALFAPSGTSKAVALKEQPYLPPVADAFNVLTSEKLPKKNWRHFYAETAPRLIVQVPNNEPTWQTRRYRRRTAGRRTHPSNRTEDRLGAIHDGDDNLIGGAYDYVFSGHPPASQTDSPKEEVPLLEGVSAEGEEQVIDTELRTSAIDDTTTTGEDPASFFLTSLRDYRRPSRSHGVASQRQSVCDEEGTAMQGSLDACDVLERWCDEVSLPSTSSASSSAAYRAAPIPTKKTYTGTSHRSRAVGEQSRRTADDRINTRNAESFPIPAIPDEESRMAGRTAQAAVRDLRALLRRPLPAVPLRHARTTASRSQHVNGGSSATQK